VAQLIMSFVASTKLINDRSG